MLDGEHYRYRTQYMIHSESVVRLESEVLMIYTPVTIICWY